jgi:serine/threonine protein kinase
MTSVPASSERPEAPLFSDGLGDRVVAVDGASGDLLQILRLRPQLLAVPSFEFALRERAARLANFRHAYYARVRRVDRHPGGLAIVADHVEGTRLSDILRVAAERRLNLDLSAALCLIRQLVPSVALLHENARDVAHGLLSPERLIVTPHARLVIAEHVLGSAVEQLQYNRERLWQDLRVALPPSAGAPRFDHRADVTAIGLVALALILGRPLRTDEYPHRVSGLLNDARAKSAMGEEQPLPPSLRGWLVRTLQLDARHGFASATEAQAALEDLLAEEPGIVAAPVALETFLSRYIAALLEPMPAPVPVPPPSVGFTPAPPAPPTAAAPAPPPVSAPAVNPAVDFSFDTLSVLQPPLTVSSTPDPFAVPSPIVTPPPAPVAPPVAAPPLVSTPPEPARPIIAPDPIASLPIAPPPAPSRDINDLLQLPPLDTGSSAAANKDALDALFSREAPPAQAAKPAARSWKKGGRKFQMPGWRRIAVVVLGMLALGEGGLLAMRFYKKPAVPPTGTVSVQTNPQGVAVFIDGVSRGNTPARLSLSPGSHILELRGRGVPRVVPITVAPGAEVSQYLELPETPSTGSLLIQSDPAGAKVSVDGVLHGVAPVNVTDLAPGDHEVVLQADGGTPVRQHVVIQAGVTSSVLAPVATASAGPVSGWLSVKSSVAMEIREAGRQIGTTDTDRIMLTAGRHELEIVNDTLGFRTSRVVMVPPGKVAAIGIDLPQGAINVNASPWAEVWIDGKRVGETPIGNLPIAIGPHEVVFRNPQFGEKRQAVSVTLSAPVRLSVDMK